MSTGPLVLGLLRREVDKADCSRRKVGAVLLLHGVVVGKGHNTLPEDSCEAGACPRGRLSYEEQPKDVGYEESGCVSVHAEDMALEEAGPRAVGSVAFVTEWPCPRCQSRLRDAGVVKFIKVTLPRG